MATRSGDRAEGIVIYCVPVPFSIYHESIEVYGRPDGGWFEWRKVYVDPCKGARTMYDSKNKNYTCAEIALRDALVEVTKDLPPSKIMA